MGVIAVFFAHLLRMCPGCSFTSLPLIHQEVRAIFKTCNQLYMSSTGELIDIERVTISSEGGRWKSTIRGNSLAAYPTSSPVLEQR